ncbi:hypothetical protein GGR50DRAFT_537906 [Xylaria sp. CBS 124048]|nr:hypothetical protein GGR50DRAFT_537906 [Xylaria sp. CBS 124048]
MPVTELALIPSATPGFITPELLAVGQNGLLLQSEWAAKHATSTFPPGPPAVRGAAIYQQREDDGIILLTAHWDSPAQHAECIASEENQEAMAAIVPHILPSEIKISHVAGVYMLDQETLDMGLLSVVKIGVRDDMGENGRARIEKLWGRMGGLLAARAGLEHKAGWRIETDLELEGREEFIVVGAWRDEEVLKELTEGGLGQAWDMGWRDDVLDMDIKTYRRIA